MNYSEVFIVVPSYHEANTVGRVIQQARSAGFHNILVVDDGSSDSTAKVARDAGAFVVRHVINRGAGAATKTGIDAALRLGAGYIVTLDADGQHRPDEIRKLLEPLAQRRADVVVGSRFLERNSIPLQRRVFNWIGNMTTAVLFGKWLSDTQSGFKAFSRHAAETVDIRSNGFEFCSELVWEFRVHNLRVAEVPISVEYTPESLRKGQSFSVGMKTFLRLVLQSLFRVKPRR